DGAGRLTKAFATDGGGDAGWADADDVIGDAVLAQTEYAYDANGNVQQTTVRQRFHDETATGALNSPGTAPKARTSYAGAWYDRANRQTDAVDVGTNAAVTWTRPASPPARSDTVLRTTWSYNAAGWVDNVTDPRGLVHRTEYDNAGRVVRTIDAYTDGTPT